MNVEPIKQLLELDLIQWFYTFVIILSGLVAFISLISKFCESIGKPIKWFMGKNEDHELLLSTRNDLDNLIQKQETDVEQSIRHDNLLKDDLHKLTQMFIDKEIDDWRWEILDFASAISAGRQYSKEQYDHVISIYEKYEKILEENNLVNGHVTNSMEVINEIYKEKLKIGF